MTSLESLATIPIAAAIERFELQRHLPRYESKDDREGARGAARLHEGDLALDGNLALDWDEGWRGVAGLIVTGDLTVRGNVVNLSGDGGPFLVVGGRLAAANVVAGGSDVWIAGGAEVEGLILGHYNHGTLRIGGETNAGLVIGDDHAMELRTASPFWNDHELPVGMPLGEYLHADVPIETMTEGLLVPCERAEVDELIARVVDGRPVLRAAGDARPRRGLAEWREMIAKVPEIMRFAPEEAVDEASCLALVAERGWMLEHVPPGLRTEAVCSAALASDEDAFKHLPEALKTPERCEAAVRHRGWNLEYVPPALRTKELCELGIDNDNLFYAIRAVPEPLMTEELCLRAVRKNVATLREMPMASRTMAVCVEAVTRDGWAAQFVPEPIRAEVLERAGESEASLVHEAKEKEEARGRPSPEMEDLLRKVRASRPSKLGFLLQVFFGSMRDSEGPWPPGIIGFFARRPALVVLLRGLVSILMIVVHVWLTVYAWRAGGAIAGITTLVLMYVSELWWAWRIATTTGVDALAVLCVASVALYVSMQWLVSRTAKVWKAREELSNE